FPWVGRQIASKGSRWLEPGPRLSRPLVRGYCRAIRSPPSNAESPTCHAQSTLLPAFARRRDFSFRRRDGNPGRRRPIVLREPVGEELARRLGIWDRQAARLGGRR